MNMLARLGLQAPALVRMGPSLRYMTAGVDTTSKAADAISDANQEESRKFQEQRLKTMGADDPSRQWREPAPYYSVGAGKVVGTTSGQDEGHRGTSPEDFKPHSAEAAEATRGQSGPSAAGAVGLQRTPAGGVPHDQQLKEQASSEPKSKQVEQDVDPIKPFFPEGIKNKVKSFVKDAASTISGGVNNAGHPGTADKLKQN